MIKENPHERIIVTAYLIHMCFEIWIELVNGILLPKLFWPTVRKIVPGIEKNLALKFEAEGREFAKILRSLEQFIQTVKGQNNFW